jgi:hypothetical protein
MASRRLERVDRAEEVFVESVNYVVPALVLVTLGTALHWRRRQTAPLSGVRDVAERRASHGEA